MNTNNSIATIFSQVAEEIGYTDAVKVLPIYENGRFTKGTHLVRLAMCSETNQYFIVGICANVTDVEKWDDSENVRGFDFIRENGEVAHCWDTDYYGQPARWEISRRLTPEMALYIYKHPSEFGL